MRFYSKWKNGNAKAHHTKKLKRNKHFFCTHINIKCKYAFYEFSIYSQLFYYFLVCFFFFRCTEYIKYFFRNWGKSYALYWCTEKAVSHWICMQFFSVFPEFFQLFASLYYVLSYLQFLQYGTKKRSFYEYFNAYIFFVVNRKKCLTNFLIYSDKNK